MSPHSLINTPQEAYYNDMQTKRFEPLALLLGDLLMLYAALWCTLLVRYRMFGFEIPWDIHAAPFGIVFLLWLLLFYIAGLYEQNAWNADRMVKERIIRTTAAAALTAVVLFYLIPAFVITPKTNLLIFAVFATALLIGWRMLASSIIQATAKTNVLFFGASREVVELAHLLDRNPHLGYRVAALIPAEDAMHPTSLPIIPFDKNVPRLIEEKNITLVVASKDIHSQKTFVRMLYDILPRGIRFIDFPTFHETLTGKIPVSLISEIWFLENISNQGHRIFEVVKRAYDMALAILFGIPALIISPLITLAIKLESRGPVFIRQQRIGKNDMPFILYKFRSMIASDANGLAENGGAEWAQKNDARITRVGHFLRTSRLDELPQFINILRGEMSFIGPRPERPEFIETLKQQIPFYEIRHLVRPGLSGWAQINFPYGASVEDAMQKLQYDLYYIKNRSLALDLNIALKTIWVILSREGR